ncbi:hypothetical protein ACK3SF_00425 [Candidatus Nanosalina sp. VS9-1]|uniref:hypothetical protein n=1 Tax=Candidatus Nanosalina sp. VS9-1 TaxID=3388566 RepID=UPI0039E1BAE3
MRREKLFSGQKIVLVTVLLLFSGAAAAEITVDARSSSGENLDQLDIEVLDTDYKETNVNEASFNLDDGTYELLISRDGYVSIERSIFVEEDEDVEYFFTMQKDEPEEQESDVALGEIDAPNSVCSSTSFPAEVEVRNEGETDEIVSLTGTGFGKILSGKAFVVPAGESQTYRFTFTGITGKGLKSFSIDLNGWDQEVSDEIRLKDCEIPGSPDSVDNVDMEIYPERGNSEASVDELVRVRGYADGAQGPVPVNITVDGVKVATVESDPGGFFEAYFRPENSGVRTVTATSGKEFDSEDLRVVPVAYISSVTAPEKVFAGEEFRICGQVNSDIEPDVVLLEDKKLVESQNGNGEVCFNVTSSEAGEKNYLMRALTYGKSDHVETSVDVLPQGSEVESFPGQISTVETEGGVLRVSLYNTNSEARNYSVRLKDISDSWVSSSSENVSLGMGERDSVYFYTSPEAPGSFTGVLEVETEKEIIYSDSVEIRVAERPPRNAFSFVDNFVRMFMLGLPF